MAIVRTTLKTEAKPTAEQLAEVQAATHAPRTYDPDCPPLTKEELRQFKHVNRMRKEKREA